MNRGYYAGEILIITNRNSFRQTGVYSLTYHYNNEEGYSRYDFAKIILELRNVSCGVSLMEMKDYPTASSCCHYSALKKIKVTEEIELRVSQGQLQ